MKKLFLFLPFTFFGTFNLIAQPSIQWQKCLGGTSYDFALSIHQTTDGGYIVAGYSHSNDGDVTGVHSNFNDYWVVKLNNMGAIQWQRSLGGTGVDQAYSIQQTNDSGYIVAGLSQSNDSDVTGNHGGQDCWVVKLNNAGNIQWQKCLGGTDGESAYSIQQTNDSGYIVAGFSYSNDSDVTGNHGNSDYWVVKLNSTGTILWQKSLGGAGYEGAYSIQQTNDSGYIVAGLSNSNDSDVTGNHGDFDYWVVKLNNIGAIQWQKSLGGSGYDEASSIQQTNDSGYIVAGHSYSNDSDVTGNHGSKDYWIVKLNNTGTIDWQKSLGGSLSEAASSIQQTNDGGYIVAGGSGSTDGDVTGHHGVFVNGDYWIVKLNSTGTIQWQKCLGGAGWEGASSIQQTSDNGYIVTGTCNTNHGDVVGNHGGVDYWVVKLNPLITGVDEFNNSVSNLQITPNPVSISTTISFSLLQSDKISVNIYDITGRFIKNIFNENLNPGEHQIKWRVNDAIEDGVFFLNLTSERFSQSCKVVKVK